MKRTPLFSAHQKLGAKLIEFGGWEMPVYYTTITDEHLTVRKAAGIFDISHMGEFSVSGPAAEEFLNRALTNDLCKLTIGQGQYTLMCNDHGGIVDDLYAYRLAQNDYLLIVNASRIETDFAHLIKLVESFPRTSDVQIRNISEATVAVAVQGPRAREFINECFPEASTGGTSVTNAADLAKNQVGRFPHSGKGIWISRTGYTGEDGFEVAAPADVIEEIWNRVLEVGRPFGLKPAGLGARDTLRTEACYPLYGNDLNEETTPIEAGLGFFVALDKSDFIGRARLAEQKTSGPDRKLAAFKMLERSAPPRPHYTICSTDSEGKQIGEVTSGTQSPSLGIGIGMGYVPANFAKPQTRIEIEVRSRRAGAEVIAKPIYRRPTS